MRDSPEIRQEESPASSSLENMAVMEVAQASQQPRCTTASVQQREAQSTASGPSMCAAPSQAPAVFP
ncbi:Protein of unknown function [Gryllus bimaculatus]|nr:Protein of unknown function [Gryllus bimaculatus]